MSAGTRLVSAAVVISSAACIETDALLDELLGCATQQTVA